MAGALAIAAFALVACQGTVNNTGGSGGSSSDGSSISGQGGTTGTNGVGGNGPGTGGTSSGAGGARPPGTGGTSGSAGSTGAAGASGVGGAIGSSGCGATTFPPGDMTYTIDVAGVSRTYIVGLPTGYDPNKKNRVVFAWHGRTGTAAQIAGGGATRAYYGLRARMTDTIFVAGQGLGTDADPADTGWPNTGGRDIAFVRAMIGWLNSNYCVDQARIFSAGFSYGGIMSHTIGCQMSDVFRAIAPIAGAIFGRPTCTTHQIAAWMTHGTMDTAAIGGVDYTAGMTARDRLVTLNHCTATTVAAAPSPCVSYEGCDSGYPVHWCSHTGAHVIPPFAAEGIANFFLQF
jgi:polyhydroxybutyrate depolymerase